MSGNRLSRYIELCFIDKKKSGQWRIAIMLLIMAAMMFFTPLPSYASILSDSIVNEISGNELDELAALPFHITRYGGNFKQGIFFASKNAGYKLTNDISVTDGDNKNAEKFFSYQIGEIVLQPEILEDEITIIIPNNVSGYFVISLVDEENKEEIYREYVISDSLSPEVEYKILPNEKGGAYVEVNLSDNMGLLSGLDEYSCKLDGNQIELSTDQTNKVYELIQNESEVVKRVTILIPLEDFDSHILAISVKDNAGNTTEKEFNVQADSNNIISVIIPTNFNINMYKDINGQGGFIESNDLILCNKSNFPIEVFIKKVTVIINNDTESGMEKACSVGMGILKADQNNMQFELNEAVTENIATFELDSMSADTDINNLMGEASKGKRTEKVTTGDCAILRFDGTINNADWQNGDLKISVVFDFQRINKQY